MRKGMEYFAIGLAAGALAGFVVGLLVAPSSGATTRRRLANEAQRAAEFARQMADRAEQAADALGGRVDHYLGRDEEVAWRKVNEIREELSGYTPMQG
ncbi:MAG: YtxH domain-containing protein [Coriobacteriia bacterium]|nr:YtxH domain-containing protein [Coriobacteriia bacterium]